MSEILTNPIFLPVLFVVMVGLLLVDRFKQPETKKFKKSIFKNYEAQSSLLVNKSELMFFKILVKRMGDEYLIMSKVRLEDIVRVKRNLSDKKEVWSLRGRIKSRHVDYLITDNVGKPLLVIELDGSSHNKRAADLSDSFKDKLFKATDIPFARIRVGQNFTKELENLVEKFGL